MATIALNGVDLHVEVHGPLGRDVPALLLLHGLGSSSGDWTPQIRALADRFRVLAVDLPGHGRSRPVRGRLSVERMAADVATALSVLGERHVHVVGLSLGGCVALALALRDPGRVRSLTLVNTFARLPAHGLRARLRLLRRLTLLAVAPMRVVAAQVARGLFPKPQQHAAYAAAVASLAANSRRDYFAVMRALAAFDVRGDLSRIACRTLVVVGDRDDRVPRAAADVLLREIPHAICVEIADSGHATPCDQPEVFNTRLVDFVESVG